MRIRLGKDVWNRRSWIRILVKPTGRYSFLVTAILVFSTWFTSFQPVQEYLPRVTHLWTTCLPCFLPLSNLPNNFFSKISNWWEDKVMTWFCLVMYIVQDCCYTNIPWENEVLIRFVSVCHDSIVKNFLVKIMTINSWPTSVNFKS